MSNNFVAILSNVVLTLFLLLAPKFPSAAAIGHNGRIDMLHTVNHKEEIDNILNKRYTGDAAPIGGEIHHVKNVVQDKKNDLKKNGDHHGHSKEQWLGQSEII